MLLLVVMEGLGLRRGRSCGQNNGGSARRGGQGTAAAAERELLLGPQLLLGFGPAEAPFPLDSLQPGLLLRRQHSVRVPWVVGTCGRLRLVDALDHWSLFPGIAVGGRVAVLLLVVARPILLRGGPVVVVVPSRAAAAIFMAIAAAAVGPAALLVAAHHHRPHFGEEWNCDRTFVLYVACLLLAVPNVCVVQNIQKINGV